MPMKHILSLLICLLLMVACGRPSDNASLSAELQWAEELMYPAPDSALHILQGMTPPADELNRATWALLLTQAKYKCDVAQTDSLVNVAYDFFMKGDDAQRKALALFCKAALLEELNESEKALNLYLDAANIVENTKDYRLAHLVSVRVGILYALRNLYDYAVEYCEKANKYALLSQDTYYITNSYNNLGRAYSAQNKYDIAISYYDKAIAEGYKYNEKKALTFALQEKAGIYIRLKKYDDALKMLVKVPRPFLKLDRGKLEQFDICVPDVRTSRLTVNDYYCDIIDAEVANPMSIGLTDCVIIYCQSGQSGSVDI